MKIYNLKSILMLLIAASGLLSSCNDDAENILVDQYPDQETPSLTARKVMWIIMDGANGAAVNYARNNQYAPYLRKMADNAVYTFSGLADKSTSDVVTKELGWANLMTGVTNHGVSGSSDLSALSVPSIIERIEVATPEKRTLLMGTDASFVDAFGKAADEKKIGTDKELINTAVEKLTGNNVPDFMILEFSDVRDAGVEHGFKTEDGLRPTSKVIEAISQIDSYIGHLKKVLDARSKENNENWLVIVTSSFGGIADNDGESIYDMADRNTFGIIYNMDFNSQLLQRPGNDQLKYIYHIPVFSDEKEGPYAEVMDASLFDIVFDKENPEGNASYTIQFMYKQGIKWKQSQHTLVSKGIRQYPQRDEGWSFNNDYCQPQFAAGWSKYWGQNNGPRMDDGEWHVVTMTIDGPQKLISLYYDGQLVNNGGKPVTLNNPITAVDVPMRIGRLSSSSGREGGDYYLTNLQFYDVALPAEFIFRNYKLAHLDERKDSYPYWDNLIGYWPMDREEDYQKSVVKDYSKFGSIMDGKNAGKSDMALHNIKKWNSGSELTENIQPMPGSSYYQAVFNNVDFIVQSLQWLNIGVDLKWGLEGIAHALPYKNMENSK